MSCPPAPRTGPLLARATLPATLWIWLSLIGAVATCSNDDSGPEDAETVARRDDLAALLAVKEVASRQLPGLARPVHVVRTEGNVAHIYAANAADLARVHGYVAARDRFFVMDLLRRLGRGRVAGLFGDFGLASDVRSRAIGMPAVAERLLAQSGDDLVAEFDAYAAGINAWIAAVKAGTESAPSEVELAAGLLGYKKPADMMKPFDRVDLACLLTVVLYQQGFEDVDVSRAALLQSLEGAFSNKALAELRTNGARADLFDRVQPVFANSTTTGYGLNGEVAAAPPPPPAPVAPAVAAVRPLTVSPASLARVNRRIGELFALFGKDSRGGFGSNIWAVAGKHTEDGAAILASDGHLTLAVPSLMWRIGLDTRILGGGPVHQLGLTFAGIPMVAAGTNGDVAWSTTYLYGDITDWYREELQLDGAGRPAASRFDGKWRPLQVRDEVYDVAVVKVLGSAGGEQTWAAWVTFDGRRLVEVEGRPATVEEQADPKKLPAGQALVNALGEVVVPGDVDGDGKITAISMDLTTLDVGNTGKFIQDVAQASDVGAIRSAMRALVGWGQNTMAVDRHGAILYSSYSGTPCRSHLPRTKDGRFETGADPRLLLDGTKYGGFTIPLKDGQVDEGATKADECVIPFDSWPQAMNPAKGWLVNANNDIATTSTDGRLGDDKWYLGGPWVLGYRAQAIEEALSKAVASGKVSGADMAQIQAVHSSTHASLFLPVLLAALDAATAASALPAAGRSDMQSRLAELNDDNAKRFSEVMSRLKAWQAGGLQARSGVATFYNSPTEAHRADAVATMLFNAWAVELVHRIFDDEGIAWPADVVLRALPALFDGRGAGNPAKLASWNPKTSESAFFDLLGTDPIETSNEICLLALQDALDRLEAPAAGPGSGGFGSADMAQWLWGLRHWLRLDALLASFVTEGAATLSALTKPFAITPKRLPLADDLAKSDPRADLPGFPRPGDYGAVDAAAPNALRSAHFPDDGVRDFSYSHGPNMRMVIALGGAAGFEGQNIVPGGQSALSESPHFADQLPLWLGNKTTPMRLSAKSVAAGASGREVFAP